jgi:hypothetical protein
MTQQAKHTPTPGPWRKCVGNGAIEIRGGAVDGIPSPRVCRVLRADPRCEENASVIVASRALLEAAIAAERLLNSVAFVAKEGDTDEPLAMLRAAISRAGEA